MNFKNWKEWNSYIRSKIGMYHDSEKNEIKSPLVKVLNKYSLCVCGNIGFNFIKKVKGFGFSRCYYWN